MSGGCRSAFSALVLLAWLLPVLGAAAPAGEATHVAGVCMVRKADGSTKVLAVKTPVEEGDVVVTAGNAYARLKFSDGGEVTLRPNSQLRIARYRFEQSKPEEDSLVFGLLKGGLRTLTGLIGKRKDRSYELQTTTATIGIRGTGYGGQLCQGDCQDLRTVDGQVPPDGLHVDVFQGSISVTSQAAELVVDQGQYAYAAASDVPPVIVPRGDAVVTPIPNLDTRLHGSGADRACLVQ